jgi:hypothetical protein
MAESEALHAAIEQALAGRPDPLRALFCRHGGAYDRRPNLKLAAAFGAELSAAPSAKALPLLARLGEDDAAPDTPEVFLPIAAAYGWTARLAAGLGPGRRARPRDPGRHGAANDDDDEREQAWPALQELAADERASVRLATREALIVFGMGAGAPGAAELLRRGLAWLDDPDHRRRFASAASMVGVLSDARVLSLFGAAGAVCEYLSRVVDGVAGAPRAAERLDSRRRLLSSLAPACAAVAAHRRDGDRGVAWLEGECARARHPDVRGVLSDAVLRVRSAGNAGGASTVDRLRRALEGSAKPPRDPTRRRPGHGRGKASRRIR